MDCPLDISLLLPPHPQKEMKFLMNVNHSHNHHHSEPFAHLVLDSKKGIRFLTPTVHNTTSRIRIDIYLSSKHI